MSCQIENEMCATHGWPAPCITADVLRCVSDERAAQYRRYGLNDQVPDGSGAATRWLGPYTGAPAHWIEKVLRVDYEEYEEEVGGVTWVHLLREEIAEAFMESNPIRLQEELVQVAALAVSWVENILMRRQWGVVNPSDGQVIQDPSWHCPADVLRSAHGGWGEGPFRVVWRDNDNDTWREVKG